MDKSKFYYPDGMPNFSIFHEIPLTGINNKIAHKGMNAPDPVWHLDEAHEIYMNSMNEYEAAMQLVPTWAFWQEMLKKSSKIKRQVDLWREEKLMKDQARAKRLLWEQAEKGNVSAQKMLFEAKKEEAQLRKHEVKAKQEEMRHEAMAEATLHKLKVVK